MRIDPIKIGRQNKLIDDYRSKKHSLGAFFDYERSEKGLQDRVNELMSRTFPREKLADVLLDMNQAWGASEETVQHIEQLRDPNSVVVIGGQQAGLLTGPLYSIHKIISIILYAKEQEEKHNRPVIPVFWIAGEDHDFDEINHVYMPQMEKMKKVMIPQSVQKKTPVSDIKLDKKQAKEWLNQVFSYLSETPYTKLAYKSIERCLNQSTTYVDFFAKIILELFGQEGIVLIDSANSAVRQLEADYFAEMITNQKKINEHVYKTHKELLYLGYNIDLDVAKDAGNLFYHQNQERILLFRDKSGNWIGKQKEVKFTTKELLDIAKKKPQLLSNNVVTRPMMQDLLFPTLAFIGGPGEISYWSVLKQAFHVLDIKMPPLIPRLSFTFVHQQIQDKMEKYDITVTDVMEHGVDFLKQKWLETQSYPPTHYMFHQLKKAVDDHHAPIQSTASQIRDDLGGLAEKNLKRIHQEIDFLQDRINQTIEEKFAIDLASFEQIKLHLQPEGGMQERIWNPLPWINEYGNDFISELMKQNIHVSDSHCIIWL